MAIYLVSGKLGAGKTLSTVGRIRDKILAGCKVATNLNLYLENLLPPHLGRDRPCSVIRIPDKPMVSDLEAIGIGNESMDEDKNGLIVLDELAAWLNARQWADKNRQAVIDWLIHSRKKGWDVMFITQHIDQIDKQIRTALVEFLVVCRRLDRMRIPLIGSALKTLSGGYLSGTMPKLHLATVRYGTDRDAIIADRWIYKGTDLYAGYHTRQVFVDRDDPSADVAGPTSYLTPWHLRGRYMVPERPLLDRIKDAARALIEGPPKPPPPALRPKLPLVALLAKLPPDQRERHWKRLESLGALSEPSPC